MKKLYALIFLLGSYLFFSLSPASADVDNKPYWQVEEITNKWNAIYGKIDGIPNLREGDSVGAFDLAGNCYGAGRYNGVYYFLSAFEEDKGEQTADDFPIPGFKEGNEVKFRVYCEADGEIYTVEPSSDAPYIYESSGMYPPAKIDLVYEDDGGGAGGGGGGGDDNGGGGGGDDGRDDGDGSGGQKPGVTPSLVGFGEGDEEGSPESDEATLPPVKDKKEEEEEVPGERLERVYAAQREKEPDYPDERKAYSALKPTKLARRDEEDDIIRTTDLKPPIAEKRPVEAESPKRRFPFAAFLLIFLILPLLLLLLARRVKKGQGDGPLLL